MARHWPAVAALWLAGAVPWALGAYAVYIESPQYTGLGLVESYQGFQVGSNVGNVLWFVLWTGLSALFCWFLSRRTSRPTTLPKMIAFVLFCYTVPALLVFLPEAAMGFAVSHVRAFTDATAPHSSVVDALLLSGGAALLAALAISLGEAMYRSQRRTRDAPVGR
ncbi:MULTISPECIES: hypothetical protein [unclassified Paenarthrobacter]|uniref:hypothetical protein n=1 Tax=unclassified Paenarthrobacter TaxID=2634190 RepID=UPI001112FC6D|nr:hypothetical protein [Paenarthrobacter sp. R1]WIV29203.1 hypothetical protein QN084_12535 [Paenarthrobacter sp. R1]